MGVLEDLLGTSTRARTATQTTLPATPQSVEQAREELIARTRGFAAEPFQPYVDAQGRAIPRVAEFTPDQQRAFESTRGLATQAGGLSALTPGLAQEGIAATRGMATTLPQTNIDAYMSPYTQGVIDPMVRAIEERAAKERLALGQQSARTGSFGGSRQAIAESELSRGTQRNIAETTAAERAKAYNQALQQFRLDQERIPQLYSTMQSQLGTGLQQTQGALGSMVNPLLATGGLQQAREQANLDVLRQQYEEERDFPMRGITALRQTLGLPTQTLGIGQQQQTTDKPGSPLNEMIKLGGSVFGSLPPAIAKSIGGWFNSIGASPGTPSTPGSQPSTAATNAATAAWAQQAPPGYGPTN